MSYESERKRLLEGKLYCPFKILDDTWNDVHKAQKEFNDSEFWHDNTAFEKLKKCFGSAVLVIWTATECCRAVC